MKQKFPPNKTYIVAYKKSGIINYQRHKNKTYAAEERGPAKKGILLFLFSSHSYLEQLGDLEPIVCYLGPQILWAPLGGHQATTDIYLVCLVLGVIPVTHIFGYIVSQLLLLHSKNSLSWEPFFVYVKINLGIVTGRSCTINIS